MRDDARACIIIPVYNHADAVGRTCQALRRLEVPLILIDDGCELACAAVLERLASEPRTHLLKLPHNQGKGAAVKAGLREAQRLGFTHALQVDADGQHDADDLPPFLAGLNADSTTLRIGYPRFDASVPRHRLYARYLTHSLVWLSTLSFALRDTMCGVKLYPVAATNCLVARHPCGDRMQFDTELPVRWIWDTRPVENLPVRVSYPLDGVSHFAMWRDNRQLTAMHLRLLAGMLRRLPRLLGRHARMTRSTG